MKLNNDEDPSLTVIRFKAATKAAIENKSMKETILGWNGWQKMTNEEIVIFIGAEVTGDKKVADTTQVGPIPIWRYSGTSKGEYTVVNGKNFMIFDGELYKQKGMKVTTCGHNGETGDRKASKRSP